MTPPEVHQIVPSLASKDAIGTHTLAVQDLLRSLGHRSDILVTEVEPGLQARARAFEEYARNRRNGTPLPWLIYQFSIDSPIVDVLARWEEPKIVNYHNITPPRLVETWSPRVAKELERARRQLEALRPVTSMAIADSSFNKADLDELGYSPTSVCAPLFDLAHFAGDPDEPTASRLREARSQGGADLLFVGRVTPHKAQHDLIKALAAYRRAFDPRARLHLVGSSQLPDYDRALRSLTATLGLEDAVNLAGSVTHEQLVAYYQSADVLVCASDHEGFCIPLLEAMYHRLPIVAYAAGAVPETLGAAGLLVGDKSPATIATAVTRVLSDSQLASSLNREAGRRLENFSIERTRARYGELLEQAIGSP